LRRDVVVQVSASRVGVIPDGTVPVARAVAVSVLVVANAVEPAQVAAVVPTVSLRACPEYWVLGKAYP